jgi:haloalkane dehalogenase
VKKLRTPEERFQDMPAFPWTPHYMEVPDGEGGTLRIAYIDQNSHSKETVLMLHGEPSWSFLYRKMIPPVIAAGYRTVVPDLPGFGRSDKPAELSNYTYQLFVDWMQSWLEQLDLRSITLVCQDWGGLIGLRLATANQERFARIVVANTGLPTGEGAISEAFLKWRQFSVEAQDFDIASIVAMGCRKPLPPEVASAYNAPFPDDTYKAGARIFPSLVPIAPDDPAAESNQAAWRVLESWSKPFLTAFSDGDPITKGGERIFHKRVPGAEGQPHVTIQGGGHFLQEDCGEDLARVVTAFIKNNPARPGGIA